MPRKLLLCLTIFCFSFAAHAQRSVLNDPEIVRLVRQSYDSIYNMNFEHAQLTLAKLEEKIPDHPAYLMLKAMSFYWEEMPISQSSPKYAKYFHLLEQAAEESDELHDENEEHPEAIFFGMTAHAMMAMQYSENKSYMSAAGEAKTAYQYMKQGFGREEEFPEFYFSSGLYNYYREQYPASYPAYRSFTWLFPNGDLKEGLKQMHMAAEHSVFMQTEAEGYLAHIYLRYRNKPQRAYEVIGETVQRYPRNIFFWSLFAESAVMTSNFQAAQPYILQLTSHDDPYYKMAGEVFKGMKLEQEGALQQARDYYFKALQTQKELPEDTWSYISYAYAGLARVADKSGNRKQAEDYYEKALEKARYEAIKQEAKAYLDE